MATSSIFADIKFEDEKSASRLADALEDAEKNEKNANKNNALNFMEIASDILSEIIISWLDE